VVKKMKMKKTIAFLFALMMGTALFAQDEVAGRKLPSVDIKTLNGEVINTSTIDNDGKPIVISFFALWCKPCLKELSAINDVYEEWRDETGVKVVIVSIDDARSMPNVKPTIDGNGWEYEAYLDPNGDLKRAMGVNLIPHVFLLNGNKEVVHQHTSYSEGSEYELYEIIQKVAAGEPLEGH
jgi:thiol-disulfide isomerase/thioredoxin